MLRLVVIILEELRAHPTWLTSLSPSPGRWSPVATEEGFGLVCGAAASGSEGADTVALGEEGSTLRGHGCVEARRLCQLPPHAPLLRTAARAAKSDVMIANFKEGVEVTRSRTSGPRGVGEGRQDMTEDGSVLVPDAAASVSTGKDTLAHDDDDLTCRGLGLR